MKKMSWVVLVAAAGCSARASCGNKKKIDAAELEEKVKTWVTADGGNPTKVDCPDEAKKNTTFGCEVELDGEKAYFVDVDPDVIDEEAPELRWRGGQGMHRKKLQEAFALEHPQLAEHAKLECEPYLYWGVKGEISCAVAIGAARSTYFLDGKKGEYRFDPPFLKVDILEKNVADNILKADAQVDCGEGIAIVRPPDGVVICTATLGAETAKVKLVFDPKLELTSHEVLPP
jgi:hypothetical protein